jgi:hypothetical protein
MALENQLTLSRGLLIEVQVLAAWFEVLDCIEPQAVSIGTGARESVSTC